MNTKKLVTLARPFQANEKEPKFPFLASLKKHLQVGSNRMIAVDHNHFNPKPESVPSRTGITISRTILR